MADKLPLEQRISIYLRGKRDVKLREIIDTIYKQRGSVRILDMGGTQKYWRRVGRDFLRARNVSVFVINLAPNELTKDPEDGELFTDLVGDACNMPEFADNSFDLVHSNSVIEHVYTWENMQAFARESHRLAPYYYIQTPNFWFPIEPHFYRLPFFHWMPRGLRIRILENFSLTRHIPRAKSREEAADAIDNCKLLTTRKLRSLYPDGDMAFEKLGGLKKSMIVSHTPNPAAA